MYIIVLSFFILYIVLLLFYTECPVIVASTSIQMERVKSNRYKLCFVIFQHKGYIKDFFFYIIIYKKSEH